MAKYIKQEMTDLHNTGKQQCYYRMEIERNISTQELIDRMSHPGSGMDRARAVQVITALGETLAQLMAGGYSVTLDGIGTFNATVGVRKGHQQDDIDGSEPKRNATTLEVDGVNYRPDKMLVMNTNRLCNLTKGSVNRLHRSPHTKEERLQMAVDYLSDPSHPIMRLKDYIRLTGISRTQASIELKEYRSRPDAKIEYVGKGAGLVYVRKNDI